MLGIGRWSSVVLLSTFLFQAGPGACTPKQVDPPVRTPAPYLLTYELALDHAAPGKQVAGIPDVVAFQAASGHELTHVVQQASGSVKRVIVRGWDPVKLDLATTDPAPFAAWRDQLAALGSCPDGAVCDPAANWVKSGPAVTLDGTLTAKTEDGLWLFRTTFTEAWPASVTAAPNTLAQLTLVTRLGTVTVNPDHPFITELKAAYQVSGDATSGLTVKDDATGRDIYELRAKALGIDALLAGLDRAFEHPGVAIQRTATAADDARAQNWKVEVDGVAAGGFKQVSGLESEIEVIEYKDGDDAVTHKRPGKAKYNNIVLRRGLTADDQLFSLYKTVLSGATDRKSGSVILLDRTGNELLRYNFFEAWPCRWKAPELNSHSDARAVEELELAAGTLERG